MSTGDMSIGGRGGEIAGVISASSSDEGFELDADRQQFEKFMVCTATGGELPVSGMDDTLSGIPGEAIELTETELAKQEALADAISLLPTPWHLPDELLFPSSGE
ncbi:hypothetical protein PHYPSEUDO_012565 [Phytophthora pseudosyringae]|uniref:Uncharacterized protein n=1 Tax=Phytophthora pseudosyringae TaxID=221518 RepID=A0A8T1V999_9STRA|nr:hypothetical protein PHYPSEUDO_012565 [Phytophthora pseudosyringae]